MVFTQSKDLGASISDMGVHHVVIFAGLKMEHATEAKVPEHVRVWFVRAWLSFVMADTGVSTMWQVPGTVWLKRPQTVVDVSSVMPMCLM